MAWLDGVFARSFYNKMLEYSGIRTSHNENYKGEGSEQTANFHSCVDRVDKNASAHERASSSGLPTGLCISPELWQCSDYIIGFWENAGDV